MAARSRAETLALSRFAIDCATFRFDREHIIQIPIVFAPPKYLVRASVHQLRVYMHLLSDTPHCSFQHVRDTQRVANLPHILFAAILHDAGAADHFQVRDFRQLGQNVVLNAVGKKRVLFLVAQIFKWQHRDAGCQWMTDKFTFPNDPARGCRESD